MLVKPDGVHRGLIGEVLSRYEDRGLKVAAAKLVDVPEELAEEHYGEHRDKPFFDGLVGFITSAPVFACVVEGREAISVVREMNGATDPQDAAPGTIRGDFAVDIGRNIVHGSDSPESAAREIKLWFEEDEILDWERATDGWVYE